MAEIPLDDIIKILNEKNNLNLNNSRKVDLKKNIQIKNLSFKHNDNSSLIFDNLNVKFENNKIYFLNGDSGIGKTTFFDILMGCFAH